MRAMLAAGLLALPSLAAAQAANPADFVGAAARLQPIYDGAAATEAKALPLVSLERDRWLLRTTRGVLEAGAFFTLRDTIRLGVFAAYEPARDLDRVDGLRGLGLVEHERSASIGPFLEANLRVGPVPLNTVVRWRRNVEEERGTQADLRLTAGLYADERVRAALYAQWTWADAESQRSEYGIDAAVAARTGLPAYRPDAGSRHAALGVIGALTLGPRWGLVAIAEYRRVAGAVAGSPLVQDEHAPYGTLGLVHRF